MENPTISSDLRLKCHFDHCKIYFESISKSQHVLPMEYSDSKWKVSTVMAVLLLLQRYVKSMARSTPEIYFIVFMKIVVRKLSAKFRHHLVVRFRLSFS